MYISLSVCVLLLLGISAVNGDTSQEPPYRDTCDYEYPGGREVRCGDQCIDKNAQCFCGSDAFRPYTTAEQCCIPSSETCTTEDRGSKGAYLSPTDDAVCSAGMKLPMSTKCPETEDPERRDLACYNSYEDSQEIGFRSHYSCPNTCVSMNLEMCRGVIWCDSDIPECGPSLRCRTEAERRLLNSSLVKEHWYCANWNSDDDIFKPKVRNNGNFDTMSLNERG